MAPTPSWYVADKAGHAGSYSLNLGIFCMKKLSAPWLQMLGTEDPLRIQFSWSKKPRSSCCNGDIIGWWQVSALFILMHPMEHVQKWINPQSTNVVISGCLSFARHIAGMSQVNTITRHVQFSLNWISAKYLVLVQNEPLLLSNWLRNSDRSKPNVGRVLTSNINILGRIHN